MITIQVLLLGPSSDLAGTSTTTMEFDAPVPMRIVIERLAHLYPRIAPALPTVRFAINQAFANDSDEVQDGDEVAVIPPVSGGSDRNDTWVELVDSKIDVNAVCGFVGDHNSHGAITTFEGITRMDRNESHGLIVRLDYEAYRGMAEIQMQRLADEAVRRWSLGRAALIHRLGSVLVGEASVMIAIASAYRDEGFTACRWLIDTLKTDVPIWKKDVYEDGTVEWVSPAFPAQGIRSE